MIRHERKKLLGMTTEEADRVMSQVLNSEAYISLDQNDVVDVCHQSAIVCISAGVGSGGDRMANALAEAKQNLVSSAARAALKTMVSIWVSKSNPLTTREMDHLHEEFASISSSIIHWGVKFDDSLCDALKVVLMVSYP